jgi:hypothetical protein
MAGLPGASGGSGAGAPEPEPIMPSALVLAALEGDLTGKVQAWAGRSQGWAGCCPSAARAGVPGTKPRFSRSAADAEKHSPNLKHTCKHRLGPADRRKEGALNKRRLEKAVPRTDR